MYIPSLGFGLIWDDPTWYRQGEGLSLWQIFSSLDTFQFYRPLAILLNRLLTSPEGLVRAGWAHALQIAIHLANTAIALPLLRSLGYRETDARLTLLIWALYPFSYQAVAWQAPQQPIATMCVWLSLLAAERFHCSRCFGFLGLSLGLYAMALLFQESAHPLSFLFFWLALRHRNAEKRLGLKLWPLCHLTLALMGSILWFIVPRSDGVTGNGLQPQVAGYLLQAIVYPLSWLLARLGLDLPLWGLLSFYILGWGLLLLRPLLDLRYDLAVMTSVWIVAGLVPVWVGLGWEYVKIAPRLLYPAALPIAALWAMNLTPDLNRERSRKSLIGAIMVAAIVCISGWQWYQFARLYRVGTDHLRQATQFNAQFPNQKHLFVNFPDRLALRSRPYPQGYWGLVLAPVAQELHDYALATAAKSAQTQSLAAFLIGYDDRSLWPYHVDLRGENASPERFWQAARWADAVLLTDYLAGGELALRQVGAVMPPTSAPALVIFGDRVDLLEHRTHLTQDAVKVMFRWRIAAPCAPGDTIFVHLLTIEGRYVRGYDGDALGGLLPFNAWQPEWTVTDLRELGLEGLEAGRYLVSVGIYNRETGQRYGAIKADGISVYEGEYIIGAIELSRRTRGVWMQDLGYNVRHTCQYELGEAES